MPSSFGTVNARSPEWWRVAWVFLCWSVATTALAASSGFQPDIEGRIYAVAAQPDGRVVIGGQFNRISGVSRTHLARLLPDGRVDPDFLFEPNGLVFAIHALPDGTLLVGGSFSTINRKEHPGLARILPDGTLDQSFLVAAPGVRSLAVDGAGRIWIVGPTKVNGLSRPGLARLLPSGALDPSFVLPPTPSIGSLAPVLPRADGGCVIGRSQGVAALGPDGSLLDGWKRPANTYGEVHLLLPAPDGGVIAVGDYYRRDSPTAPKIPLPGVMRFTAGGTHDPDYPKAALDPGVLTAAAAPDGRLFLVLGTGWTVGPQARALVCLHPDGTLVEGWGGPISGQPFAMTHQAPDSLYVVGNDMRAPMAGLPRVTGSSGGTARFRTADGTHDYSHYTAWRLRRWGGALAWDPEISDPLVAPFAGLLPNLVDYALQRNGSADAGLSMVGSLNPGGPPGVRFSYTRQSYDADITLQRRVHGTLNGWQVVARARRGGPLEPLVPGAVVEQAASTHSDYDAAPAVFHPPASSIPEEEVWYRLSVTPWNEP